jgi:hypothetical protein
MPVAAVAVLKAATQIQQAAQQEQVAAAQVAPAAARQTRPTEPLTQAAVAGVVDLFLHQLKEPLAPAALAS